MGFLIGLLTAVMLLNCIVLILLILIQLPKKETGAGLAFGAGATDALFGAGSGTVLTKITKYSAGIFFGLAIVLSLLRTHFHMRNQSAFEQSYGQTPAAPAGSPGALPHPTVSTNIAGTNVVLTNVPSAPTGAPAQPPKPAAPATNPPAKK